MISNISAKKFIYVIKEAVYKIIVKIAVCFSTSGIRRFSIYGFSRSRDFSGIFVD